MTKGQQFEINKEILDIQKMIDFWKDNNELDKNKQVLVALEYAKYSLDRVLED